jgi:hypothetical protein
VIIEEHDHHCRGEMRDGRRMGDDPAIFIFGANAAGLSVQ